MPLDSIEDWDRILVALNKQSGTQPKAEQKLDLREASKAALSGDHWHDNMLRLTASWVAAGKSDDQIHDLAATYTLDGYTEEKTRADVQPMIDGARAKGFAPDASQVQANGTPFLEHVANIELTAPQYLIHGIMEQKSLGQMFGEPGSGKSFMAIDVACSISSGKDFHGRPVHAGPVIYIAGEGRRGVVRRINAWAIAHSIDLSSMPLYVSRTAVGINNGNNLSELKAEISSIAEQNGSPELIILDTLARNFGDGDENDTRDMTRFIAEVDRINDEFECASLIVHHAGHGEKSRARGSSALKGALDAEYKITKQDDRITMSCTKMKDDDEPEPMCFYLITTEIGQDTTGSKISSAVLEFRGTAAPESARLTKSQWFGVNAFREAAEQIDKPLLDFNPVQLHLDEWRDAFYRRATQPNPDTKRKAFDRVRKDLQEKGWLIVDNDVYTLTPRTPGQSPDKQD